MGRKRVGIIFNFSSGWLGGIIYIINIVKTLAFLADKDRPEVFLFFNDDTSRFLDEIKYPYLHTIKWQFAPILKGYVVSMLSGKNLFIEKMISEFRLDTVYPVFNHPVKCKYKHKGVKVVSWFADLQHKYYPQFFTPRQRLMREARLRFMLNNTKHLVVSSQAVADDFTKFYRLRDDMKMHIYHFTSIVDSFDFGEKKKLLRQYNLPDKYFLVSNQFHKHKNHRVLLQALALLKKQGISLHFAFTGKFPQKNDSPYIKELYEIIEQNELKEQVTFLGVISRHDQLSLMHHCQAVIQPSLFEGWSTVIEDAISIQTPVIASDLPVNIEQLGDKGIYFPALNEQVLADILSGYPERNDFARVIYEEYETRVKRGANQLLNILLR